MQILILSCSSRKTSKHSDTEAMDLYNGVFFSMLKKARLVHTELSSNLRVLIVSAKYGLIDENEQITTYDQKMTLNQAMKQRVNNTYRLINYLKLYTPSRITVVMGKTYRESVDFSDIDVPVNFITGQIGEMLHKFKNYLSSTNTGDINAN